MLSPHLSVSMKSSVASSEGVLMVAPSKSSSSSFPFFVIRKIFGSGRSGVYVSRRCTARGDRISMPWAASPPITFCHEYVTTSHFDQSIGCANTALVASLIARPSRSAGIQSKFGIFAPAVVPFCVKTMSAFAPREAEIRQRAVRAADVKATVLQLQMFGVGDPLFAEAFPGENVDRSRAQHRPEHHFHGAGIGRRDDRDPEVRRNAAGALAIDRSLLSGVL